MRDLSRLLRPRSIAVIGGGWGVEVVRQCLKMGFEGPIWPVHPTRVEIEGVAAFPSLSDLPGIPDAVFIAVNRQATVAAVAELSTLGAGGAVCFASGFAEAEDGRDAGEDLQAALVDAAGEMPVLGPNCYGLINYLDGALLWPDQHGGIRRDCGVALISQSGNVLINLTMQARGLPIAYAITAGNQAQTSIAGIAEALLEDPRVTAIGLFIEGAGDIRGYERLTARARETGTPVVALKTGRSEVAQRVAISHTASLTGSGEASKAFFSRLGIPMVDNVPRLLETLKLLHIIGPLPARNVATISCSGGEASLAGDTLLGHDLVFKPFSPAQKTAVQQTLSPLVTIDNPLDYHTFIWGDRARMEACFTAVLACDFGLAIFILDFPRQDRCADASWRTAVEAIAAAKRTTGARVAVTASLPETMPEQWTEELAAQGLVPLIGLDESFAAAAAAASITDAWALPLAGPILSPAQPAEGIVVNEHQAKQMLARFNVPVPKGEVAATAGMAAGIAISLTPPLALKGLGIAHKTESGAVRLTLTPDTVEGAARCMNAPHGYLVEEMVADAVAELIVGVTHAQPYGLALTIGAGGILTELLAETATLMIPSDADAIRKALLSLKTAPLLTGFRGKPPADIEAIVTAILAIQAFATAHADRLIELDINPLIATPTTAIAVDALIHLSPDDDTHNQEAPS